MRVDGSVTAPKAADRRSDEAQQVKRRSDRRDHKGCSKHGISGATFYKCRAKYAVGRCPTPAGEALEEENAWLKKLDTRKNPRAFEGVMIH